MKLVMLKKNLAIEVKVFLPIKVIIYILFYDIIQFFIF